MKKRDIVILAAIVLGLAFLTQSMVIWDGSIGRPVKIAIRDRDGKPVHDAQVLLIQRLDEYAESSYNEVEFIDSLKAQGHCFNSDLNGNGTINARFGAGGNSGFFGKTGHFAINGDLVVSHPDFLGFRMPLLNFTQKRRIPLRKSEITFTVYLDRTKKSVAVEGPGSPNESGKSRPAEEAPEERRMRDVPMKF